MCKLPLSARGKEQVAAYSVKEKEAFVKRYLLAGNTRKGISDGSGLPYSTVRSIADRLVRRGDLIEISTRYSVPVYEDPKDPSTCAYKGDKIAPHDQGPGQRDPRRVILPPLDGGECPDGYVDLHLAVGLECSLRKAGSFDVLRKNGEIAVEWDDPVTTARQTTRTGHVYAFGGPKNSLRDWKVTYYKFTSGKERLVMFPIRVPVLWDAFESVQQVVDEVITQRAAFVRDVYLKQTGWQFDISEVDLNNVHIARELDGRSIFIIAKYLNPNARYDDLVKDHSLGVDEVEMEGLGGPEAFIKAKFFANSPSEFARHERLINDLVAKYNDGKITFDDLKSIVSGLADDLKAHAEHIHSLERENAALQARVEFLSNRHDDLAKVTESTAKTQNIYNQIFTEQLAKTAEALAETSGVFDARLSKVEGQSFKLADCEDLRQIGMASLIAQRQGLKYLARIDDRLGKTAEEVASPSTKTHSHPAHHHGRRGKNFHHRRN